ncbi:alpha/beta hydrolase [Alcaligenaceae bacterium]|nr:alpha/beta hydrolase [Alcaligenaceae bacterium]
MQTELFPSFRRSVATVESDCGELAIPFVVGGEGPPMLLLHGFPQTHAMWHKAAPALARNFTVVASDLRGYGDATKPSSDGGKLYSKRAMAADQWQLMRSLGYERFGILAHDRGARVAHRLALDHPDAVDRLMLLDVAPTLSMYEQTDLAFATVYWHWFFLIQKAPLPETLIGADPEFMLRSFMGGRHAGMKAFAPEAWAEYVRAARDPATVHAMCEDYRAAATVDLEHDREDRAAGRILRAPLRVLWGEFGGLNRCLQPLERWKDYAPQVQGRALPCGHYIAEEQPDLLIDEALAFFGGAR